MKILVLHPDRSGYPGEGLNYYGFFKALSRVAEVRMAGQGYPDHKPGESTGDTVKRLYGGDAPDWVIDADDMFHTVKPQPRDYRVGVFVSDLHGKWSYKINSPQGFRELIDRADYDAVFYRYNSIEGTDAPPDLFHHVKADTAFIPWSVDTGLFKPGDKTIDAAFLGATYGHVYPMRKSILEELGSVAREYRVLAVQRPPYRVTIPELRGQGAYVGEDYARILGATRIFIFDCSIYQYPIQKFFEAMSSGCLVMSNRPTSASSLGLVDGRTYAEITPDSWRGRLRYFLENWEEADAIARAGCNITRRFHSHEERARQFLERLNSFTRPSVDS